MRGGVATACGWVMAGMVVSAAGGDWPAWRGANAQGSVAEGRFPERWTTESVAWKVALPGKGTSTPIVSGGRLFLTSPSEGQDAVLAFDLDGKKLWETKVGSLSDPKHRSLASSCNASPATDGTAVYVHFKSGNFAAVETDGKVRWRVNLKEKFGVEKLYWDSGTSPVVVGDVVILSRLHDGESWVAAFDRKTGEIRWREKRNYTVPAENNNGYATPVVIDHGGQPAVLVWGADHLTAHAVSDGHVLWSAGGFNPDGTGYWPAIATPVVHGSMALVPVGRDDRAGQARMFGIKLGGAGDVSESHRAWKRTDVGVFVAAPVISGDADTCCVTRARWCAWIQRRERRCGPEVCRRRPRRIMRRRWSRTASCTRHARTGSSSRRAWERSSSCCPRIRWANGSSRRRCRRLTGFSCVEMPICSALRGRCAERPTTLKKPVVSADGADHLELGSNWLGIREVRLWPESDRRFSICPSAQSAPSADP